MAPSSSGLGRRPLKAKVAGSNPVGATTGTAEAFASAFLLSAIPPPLLELQNAAHSKLRKRSIADARTPIPISAFPIYVASVVHRSLGGGCSRLLSKRPAAAYSICNKQLDRKAEEAYTRITLRTYKHSAHVDNRETLRVMRRKPTVGVRARRITLYAFPTLAKMHCAPSRCSIRRCLFWIPG